MFSIDKKETVPYSAEKMFALVEDIEHYPAFLPWCSKTQISFRDDHKTIATLYVAAHGAEIGFTTENEKRYPSEIILRNKQGPFQSLDGFWRFVPISDKECQIVFHLSFGFSNFLMETILKKVFGKISETMVAAFIARADALYRKEV